MLLVLTFCVGLRAQSEEGDMMARLQERFKNMQSLTAPVTQTRHNALLTEDVVSKGTFYFKKPSSMCLSFNNGSDMLLMKGDQFIMVRDGKSTAMSGKGNTQMEALKTLLKNFSAGQESDMSVDDFADVEVERDGDLMVMTIIPRIEDAKARRKMLYSSFVVTVNTKAGELKSIRLNEKGTNYTHYDFGKFQLNAPVDDKVFDVK